MRAHRASYALPIGYLDKVIPPAIPVPYLQFLRTKRRWVIEPNDFELHCQPGNLLAQTGRRLP